jgi:hypothetical protein
MIVCQNCGGEGDQKYCPGCGQALQIERISINSLLHEVAHTFWHLEKGFLYTLKELAINPGTTQRKYISGIRLRYQKPFPLFAISVTFCALALFFIYRNAPNRSEQFFYKHYFFMVQAAMLPLFALITYILFKSRNLFYAEASCDECLFVRLYVCMHRPYQCSFMWWIIVKSIIGIVASYLLFQVASNLVMQWLI